jgi:general stress protein CsbA
MVLIAIPHAVRESLFFFLLIFLLRAVLRNQWAAAVAFALIFASLNLGDVGHPYFNMAISFFVLLAWSFLVLRWGLLALCASVLFANAVNVPAGSTSAWYFGGTVFVLGVAVALAGWAFHTSLGGRKLWKGDLLG